MEPKNLEMPWLRVSLALQDRMRMDHMSRDLQVASLEAGLLELNDRLATAVRHQMLKVQEVDVRLRAHIDKTVVDILAALQATDGNLRTLVGSACSALEDALGATIQALGAMIQGASDLFETDRQESRTAAVSASQVLAQLNARVASLEATAASGAASPRANRAEYFDLRTPAREGPPGTSQPAPGFLGGVAGADIHGEDLWSAY